MTALGSKQRVQSSAASSTVEDSQVQGDGEVVKMKCFPVPYVHMYNGNRPSVRVLWIRWGKRSTKNCGRDEGFYPVYSMQEEEAEVCVEGDEEEKLSFLLQLTFSLGEKEWGI